MTLEQQIEGVLFYKATPMKKAALQKMFNCTDEELNEALSALHERLREGGTRLILLDNTIELVTAPELDELIESLRKDELQRDIGKAGAETLAIILYRGPISRAAIDRIRGVNSSYILRNMMVRGLIEKTGDQREIRYTITTELMAHLGITNPRELPHFAETMDALDTYEAQQTEQET